MGLAVIAVGTVHRRPNRTPWEMGQKLQHMARVHRCIQDWDPR
jgi:hypothetical protein